MKKDAQYDSIWSNHDVVVDDDVDYDGESTVNMYNIKTAAVSKYSSRYSRCRLISSTLPWNEQKHLSASCSAMLSCNYFSLLFSSLATNNVKVEG